MSDGKKIVWFNAGNYEVRKQYSYSFEKNIDLLSNELRLCQVNLLNVSTVDDIPIFGE